MLRLQALEERIVLDAALMVELDEAEREDDPDVEGAPEGGAYTDADADAQSADFAAAAMSLIDPLLAAAGGEVLPEPLQYREGDGVRSVMAAWQLPVLAPSEGYALWATVSLEGASVGDELLAPDSAAEGGGFIVTRSGEHSITLTATDSLLLENSPAEVEELLRNTVALVGYANSAQDPLEGPRTIHVALGNADHEASASRFVFVTSVNDAPNLVAAGDTSLVFTEPADPDVRAPIALFQPDSVTISDADSALIGRASVWIIDAPASMDDPLGTFDRLLVDLPVDGSITSRLEFTPSLDGTMGELRLTLEGSATAETYSRLLETVRFDSLDIDPQQVSRNVRISVVDVDDDGVPEEAVSASIERRIEVRATNTMPIVDLVDASFSEAVHRLTPVALFPELELRDPDSGNQLARVVLVLDNPGRLTSDSFNVYLAGSSLFSVERVTDGTRDAYTILPKAASGVASVTEFQSFLKTWTYANTSRANVDHDVGIAIEAYDPQGAAGTATSRLVIVANPDAPQSEGLPRLGTPDALTVTEDGQLSLPASLFPFRDPDGDLLAGVSITALPGHGSLVMSGRVVQEGEYIPEASLATLVYVPDPDYNGPDGFRFKVWDNSGSDGGPGLSSTEQQASITVTPVNDAPVAGNGALTVDEESTGTDLGLAAPSDVDGDSLTITVTGLPTLGGVTLADGTAVSSGQILTSAQLTGLKYDAPADYNGTDSVGTFTYSVDDGQGQANSLATGTVTLVVNPVNDVPVAVDDRLAATEDTPVTFSAADLLGNDRDVDGDPLTIASVTSGTGGTAVLNADGTVTFTPNANFNGVADFTYTVTDGTSVSNTATVTVSVAAVNDAPVAVDDSLVATEDTPATFTAAQLLGNDRDVDGDPLTIASVTSGTGGSAVLNADGTVTFTPNAHFNGVADFTYTVTDGTSVSNVATVTVSVAAINDAPVAVDDSLVATEDTPVTFTAAQLLGNDVDVDGDTLAIASVTSGTGGSAVLNADGTVTFTPNADFNGVADFSYTVTDGKLVSNTATVTVSVAAVNDAPVAVDDRLAATEGTAVTFTAAQLLGNDRDIDGDPLAIASVTSGTGGSAVLNADGTVTFTPNADFNGVADFSYTVTDGKLVSNTATVTVSVAAVNDAPVAVDDRLAATEDTPVTFTAAQLLSNDVDVDGDTLAIASVTSGTGGTAVLNADGTVSFTPNAHFNGVADFTYTVTDGTSVSNVATVTVSVAAVNDAPVAVDDRLAATEDTAVTFTAAQLLGNDRDIDGDPLSIASVTSGMGGTAVLNADGTVTFTPNANFNGVADFTYTVTDGTSVSNVATVTVSVAAINDAPVAVDDRLAATEDTPVTFNAADLLGNDRDIDGDPLTIASVTSGTGGTAVLNADGTVTFTPNANFNGVADFTYTVTDGTSVSNTATVTVSVAAVNDAPVAVDDRLAATEDTPVTFTAAQLLGNDRDVDGDTLAIASVTSGTGGSAVLNADGTVTFTPNANFNGVATFSYTVTDGKLVSNTATVTVNVAAVDDPEPILAVFGSSDDGRDRSEPDLSPTPPLDYSAQFAYDVINYEVLLEPLTYPELDAGSEPERFLAMSDAFEVCTLYPLLGIGCRLVPAVVDGEYLLASGRGTLAYATPEAPGVPPEPLTHDGSFVDEPAQPSNGFNAELEDAFAHELADSDFLGVEPGAVVLPPEAVVVPEVLAPAPPETGEEAR